MRCRAHDDAADLHIGWLLDGEGDSACNFIRFDGGMLRVALGSSLAVREAIPRHPPLLDRHPAWKVQLIPEDRLHDLVAEDIDVALRFGKHRD